MTGRRVALVTIGQTPRPDLVQPVRRWLVPDVELLEVGALDGLDAAAVAARAVPLTPAAGQGARTARPLGTRLADGTAVTLDESVLAPLVSDAIGRAAEADVRLALLLCAGGFEDVTSPIPLIRPARVAAALLEAAGVGQLVTIVPVPEQVDASRDRWRSMGFTVDVVVAAGRSDITRAAAAASADAVVLDYVGHPPDLVAETRARAERLVVDLGEVGAAALAALA